MAIPDLNSCKAAWEAVGPQVLRRLNWAADAESAIGPLREALDRAHQTTAADWETHPAVRLEAVAGKGRLVLSPLDRMEDPASLRRLRHRGRACCRVPRYGFTPGGASMDRVRRRVHLRRMGQGFGAQCLSRSTGAGVQYRSQSRGA